MKPSPPSAHLSGLLRGAALLALVHLIGTLGYMYIGRPGATWIDSFYMTFITVATIGFGEIIDMTSNQPARILTVIIGILGAGNLSMLFSVVKASSPVPAPMPTA